ncbi:transcriptional regulator domain-containing protein [Chelativorans sp.]|uniref:transcriptional regulator domain-containing protein n=1 Tax=Chelativorans sp. TaxID=2203393 RepID=UPI0028114D54|nr:DUF6499 domain-containing protein [Chelativorans sp.]
MPAGDWTDPANYEHMRGYEAAEFAAEYLLRNRAFLAECHALSADPEAVTGELIAAPAFVAKWGLRFPRGP